jgi:fatty acyl-CoA reductase
MESIQDGAVSIKRELGGATVLLTGATGYVGSVVLEQLLRCSSVRRVYCLLRAKKGTQAQARLHSLFHANPLFHLVRDTPAAKRATAVEGDISMAGLGLSAEDRSRLQAEAQYIIHCAADIALEADIQVRATLFENNFTAVRSAQRSSSSVMGIKPFWSIEVHMLRHHAICCLFLRPMASGLTYPKTSNPPTFCQLFYNHPQAA